MRRGAEWRERYCGHECFLDIVGGVREGDVVVLVGDDGLGLVELGVDEWGEGENGLHWF